ncbi:MAG: hypothetical protein ABFD46_09780, partial [Armatimonadota bacterium]
MKLVEIRASGPLFVPKQKENVMLNLIHYRPTDIRGFEKNDGFTVSLVSTKKQRIWTMNPSKHSLTVLA